MKDTIQELFAGILEEMGISHAGINVEIPENSSHGDYTTNVAMLLAGRLKAPPVKIAQQIVDAIKKHQKESDSKNLYWLEKVELAPPGFINLWLSAEYFGKQIETVLKEKEHYGISFKNHAAGSDGAKEGAKQHGVAEGNKKPSSAHKKEGKKALNEAVLPSDLEQNAGKSEKKSLLASYGNQKKRIFVEFAHPNTHKAFHIGHLRNITTGEAMVRLMQSQGHEVKRFNYQGDVGMHIAKALYALLELSPYKEDVHGVEGIKSRVEFLGKAYAAGSKAFEEDEKAQGVIKDLNALIYASAQRYAKEVGRNPGTTDYLSLVRTHVHPLEEVYALWKETRQWSLDYFETIYARVGSHFDRYFFESECLSGIDIAKDAVKKGILKESDGAIVFDGKPYGIDTRVYVNSLGLPTYEGKELALSRMETTEFGTPDHIIHVVGPEQASFFTSTFKAEEVLGFVNPGVQYHLIYGWVKLKHGKMSSRSGNVILGEWLLDEAKKEIYSILEEGKSEYSQQEKEEIAQACAVAAVKYAYLKVGTKQEIAFDLKESVSFEGDSGPYLQYTYARCMSVLKKAGEFASVSLSSFNEEERILVRRISQYALVIEDAANRFTPNSVCTYLFQLAQEFNTLYAKHPILKEPARLMLTQATAQVIKNGLTLLGIPVIERM
jgi:arginyl-tRNA synthetase